MTKEELEKEAYLYAKNSKDVQNFECGFDIAFKSYLASAEPREKQIEIDAKQIIALQKDKGNLTDRVKELEAQIEKMKCDVLFLIKDRMNDDIDQNIIERLVEKWEIKEK